jgi:hypothetical protein
LRDRQFLEEIGWKDEKIVGNSMKLWGKCKKLDQIWGKPDFLDKN